MLFAASCRKTLVTGLWGCGAFGMKLEDLIDRRGDALGISDFQPEEIVFAILLDSYTKEYSKEKIIELFQRKLIS